MSELIKNPITIVLAFDAANCNPNGDPDNDNNPRQFEDGIGYMSSESIKYKIRSFIRDKVFFGELDADGHRLYCSPDTFSIETSVKDCVKPIVGSKKPKDIPTDMQLEAYRELCRYFYDARMFGLVNTSYSDCSILNRIKGACQVSMPVSYDPVEIIPMGITRCCVSSDAERNGKKKATNVNMDDEEGSDGNEKAKNRMMGRRCIIRYGLYHMSIQINSAMAQRNGVTMDDVNLLIEALQHMFEADMSSGRMLTLRKLVVVEHTKPMGNTYRDTIEQALEAKLKRPDDAPTTYGDYEVTYHREMLPDEVKVTEYSIGVMDGKAK